MGELLTHSNNWQGSKGLDKSHKSASIVAGLYALFSGCWIVFSDKAVEATVSNVSEITWLQTAKGWFFVAITATLLYVIVRSFIRRIEQAFKLDGMTGLLSHDLFKLQLTKLINARKTDEKIVVFVLDINHFKEINARHGFEKADRLIKSLANAITDYSLPNSLISRLPPDQFMLARNLSETQDLEVRLSGFVDLVAKVGDELFIESNCSIGVAVCPADGVNAKQLMDAAGEALRTAKTYGNAVQYHDRSFTEQAQAKRKLVESLKQAINEESLSVVYQPKYVLETNEVSGVEVLIRWIHPVEGFISPAEFIPVAEEYGLSKWISQLVIRRVATELLPTDLLGGKIKHVAINVSAAEFNRPGDMDELINTIKLYPKLSPFLRIELTETATLTDIQQSNAIILNLRNEGLSISIDDFGTGYTSLAMLKDLTIDELKVDRSFVANLGKDGRSTTIVAAIIGMAKSFGINVVAEGVETVEQLNIFKKMECDEVQGFLLGKPMSLVNLQDHLHNGIAIELGDGNRAIYK